MARQVSSCAVRAARPGRARSRGGSCRGRRPRCGPRSAARSARGSARRTCRSPPAAWRCRRTTSQSSRPCTSRRYSAIAKASRRSMPSTLRRGTDSPRPADIRSQACRATRGPTVATARSGARLRREPVGAAAARRRGGAVLVLATAPVRWAARSASEQDVVPLELGPEDRPRALLRDDRERQAGRSLLPPVVDAGGRQPASWSSAPRSPTTRTAPRWPSWSRLAIGGTRDHLLAFDGEDAPDAKLFDRNDAVEVPTASSSTRARPTTGRWCSSRRRTTTSTRSS